MKSLTAASRHTMLLLLCLAACNRPATPQAPSAANGTAPNAAAKPAATSAAQKMLDARAELDRTLWAQEELAQQYEETFIKLSDTMREKGGAANPTELLAFAKLLLPAAGAVVAHDWGVLETPFKGAVRELSLAQTRELFAAMGVRILQNEFHHQSFSVEAGVAQSVFSFELHALRAQPQTRYIARGKLKVLWKTAKDAAGLFVPDVLEPMELRVLERSGPAPFREMAALPMLKLVRELAPNAQGDPPAMPLMAYDLNGDGLSEIVLPGSNLVLWNQGGGRLKPEPLLTRPAGQVSSAVLADFTGDGNADLLLTPRAAMPVLIAGDAQGRFTQAVPKSIQLAQPLHNAFACTAGDMDGDGDLDLWITQYQAPYLDGQFPTPYYDANDGWPASLLINDGQGNFKEATEAAGLDGKRKRRTYSTSFYDVDGDHDLDLVVINDFAGLDVYLNDGKGRFTDVTDQLGQDRFSFGMSHSIADFDRDGRLDLYMAGMGSTTARRLVAMGVGRKEFPEHNDSRMRLGYGNRLLLGGAQGLRQAAYNDRVARSGWSWGTTAFDFDLDGDEDIYIGNGHHSRKTVKDYCTTFWRHDIYTPATNATETLGQVFGKTTFEPLKEISWNGFEHKVLFLNEGNGSFLNISWLMDMGQEYDARSLISDDVDGDGRPDLLMVEYGWDAAASSRPQTLHIYRNHGVNENNWIGVRLREHGRGFSPVGARITVHRGAGPASVAQLVTGDSFRAQHANQRQFGLGAGKEVEAIEVRWPNGKVSRIEKPAINQYHEVKPE